MDGHLKRAARAARSAVSRSGAAAQLAAERCIRIAEGFRPSLKADIPHLNWGRQFSVAQANAIFEAVSKPSNEGGAVEIAMGYARDAASSILDDAVAREKARQEREAKTKDKAARRARWRARKAAAAEKRAARAVSA